MKINERAVKGMRYRVISDDFHNFDSGDIVVALETDNVPFCALEKTFKEKNMSLDISDYDRREYHPLINYEIEEIE